MIQWLPDTRIGWCSWPTARSWASWRSRPPSRYSTRWPGCGAEQAMWKITRRSLWARKWRFLLTVLAVTLGVSFVTASFVLSDSLRSVFGKLSDQISAPIDVVVRGRLAFGNADD